MHHVNVHYHSHKQLDTWAPALFDKFLWINKLAILSSYVYVKEKIVGYSDLQPSGNIDHFFCHYCYQEQGIGSTLIAHSLT